MKIALSNYDKKKKFVQLSNGGKNIKEINYFLLLLYWCVFCFIYILIFVQIFARSFFFYYLFFNRDFATLCLICWDANVKKKKNLLFI